ncbi:MAG: glycerol-3-phosphate dehydrogenase/oxidase [Candidatus Acidiferrales bacterium]
MRTRGEAVKNIHGKSFDVCVIGGGATGSGCALDAQLRGLKTVQLEAGDFASATSSTSTKMIHGGVRYLEQAIREFDIKEYEVLTRALHERIHMLRNAPYLTKTELFLTPCYNWFSVLYFEIGLKLYDWIAGRASIAPSFFIARQDVLRRMKTLHSANLVGAVAYTDGQFDDARFNLALVKTFADAGGEPLNYARVTGFEKAADGKITGVQVEDQLSHQRFAVRARAFINATGPYSDTIRQMVTPDARPRMRLSKGVHILLPLDVLSSEDAMLIPKTEDGRVLFAIPWFGRLLVGTTEKEVEVHDELYVTRDEVEYLLRHLNRYLARPVTPDQIVSCIAGARPLVSSAGAKATRKLARDHEIELDSSSGLISVMGGKWTTYRAMAQDAINATQEYLGTAVSASLTSNHPLAGSERYSADYWRSLMNEYGVSEISARHLAQKFGTRAPQVIEIANRDASLAAPLVEGRAPLCAEVVFGVRHEMAASIDDILARRTGLQLYSWRDAITAAPVVAQLLGQEFGWSEAATREAADRYIAKIRDLMQKAGLAPGVPATS